MPVILRSILLLIIINIVGCSQVDEKEAQSETPLFQKIAPTFSGFNFTNILAENENFNLFTWLYIYNGAGLATGDINNDGLVDIYMISNVGPNKLFLNEGNMKFKDITNQSKTSAATGYKTGVTMVDINGDGWLDIYLCRDVFPDPKLRRNLVYINNKDMTFSEKGVELGLVDESYSTQALFLDIDQDNDLDVYLINHPESFEKSTDIKSNRSRETQNNQTGNILFENVNGKFVNISQKAAVDFVGFGLSGIANDFNNDGLTDIYVANDFI
ncbi:MAG: VCBS repeat-containing protein, partial [Cyclobacteriaceae bacterium]